MDERKLLILNTIIKEHIATGAPVGSGVLVDKYKLDISPATVRNEMASLEDDGYIVQPHTSAGRIPTEDGYKLFLENFVPQQRKKLKKTELEILDKHFHMDDEYKLKQTAKVISEISGLAVFWAFHKFNFYYTGISNLFKQPEFANSNLIFDISSVIDRMEEIIESMFDKIELGDHLLLGRENPFGQFCSVILIKYKSGDNVGIFGILGPMRMDYEKNLALVEYIKDKISNKNIKN